MENLEPPIIKFCLPGGQDAYATWENTCVYEHHPIYREVDHIFIGNDETNPESMAIGTFIFRACSTAFDGYVRLLRENHYPYHFSPIPSEMDMESFMQANTQDLDGGIPEEWDGTI